MGALYSETDPYERGMLAVGDGNSVYWELCGHPHGKPAVVLHGGPGSGCSPWHRQLFDRAAYRVVLFDQRGCGRSRPHASALATDLATNTTFNLINDMERLREHLGIDRWLLLGGSWGSTLALAYAEKFASRVSEIVLFGVTTGRRSEFDWTFRGGLARFFPEEWQRLRSALPEHEDESDPVDAFSRVLEAADPTVRQHAAYEWCLWESAISTWPPSHALEPRFTDAAYAAAFARLVTHYVRHDAWLEDGQLVRDAAALAEIDGVAVNGPARPPGAARERLGAEAGVAATPARRCRRGGSLCEPSRHGCADPDDRLLRHTRARGLVVPRHRVRMTGEHCRGTPAPTVRLRQAFSCSPPVRAWR